MGFFDKMLDVMRLSDDDDEYYDDDVDDLYDDDEEEVERPSFFNRKHTDDDTVEEKRSVVKEKPAPKVSAKITPMRGGKKATTMGMEVCVIKPTSFEDAREIAETLLSDRTIILNMEGLDLGLAQRIIDVISGACFAIEGNLQKISNYIFIVTPASVDISGDIAGLMDAFDFSGIQTGL